MKLYLMRHGEAMPESVNPDKPLTDKGKEDVQKVAAYLKKSGITLDAVWHSTKTRAKETAQTMVEGMGLPVICEAHDGLSPNDSVDEIVEKIRGFSCEKADGSLLVVGHVPFLGKLAVCLLSGSKSSESSEMTEFLPAGILCLEQKGETDWQSKWMLNPDRVE
ncbi:MAG: phosphohistidine phosphatase SixA [Candidatus Omnitrophica bacterium]|nr:phosphohistidine phosphatase SixA [Candidatus Omnitrophota bacterium]